MSSRATDASRAALLLLVSAFPAQPAAAVPARVWMRMDVYGCPWPEFECDSAVVEVREGQSFGPSEGLGGWRGDRPAFRVLELREGPRARLWFSSDLAVRGRPWPISGRPRAVEDSLVWLDREPLTLETPSYDDVRAITLRLLASPGDSGRSAEFTYAIAPPRSKESARAVRCPYRPLRRLPPLELPALRGWRRGGTTLRIQGRCRVDEQGRVTAVSITRSIPGTDSVVTAAARAWRFLPQIEGGAPVSRWYEFGFFLEPE